MIVLSSSPAIMKRRFVAALIVVLAVLFSHGGGHVLAAICPHMRAAQPDNSCHTNSHNPSSDEVGEHHQPDHKQVEQSHGPAFETTAARCNHCVVHSRGNREEPAVQQAPASPRADDQKSAVPAVKVEPPSLLKTSAWSVRSQGPPGPTAPLHVLFNVFRI